jgi:hypothetical protein
MQDVRSAVAWIWYTLLSVSREAAKQNFFGDGSSSEALDIHQVPLCTNLHHLLTALAACSLMAVGFRIRRWILLSALLSIAGDMRCPFCVASASCLRYLKRTRLTGPSGM